MILRLFKTWEHIPALQGVSRTVSLAASRLASFGIIVVCLVTLFAGSAMMSFGQQMEEFHDIQTAFISTLIVITTGEASIYEKQYLIDPLFASIWHWLLIAVMWVVCLNLVLCILVDAYTEAMTSTQNQGNVPSLFMQAQDLAEYYLGILGVQRVVQAPVLYAQQLTKGRPWKGDAKCEPEADADGERKDHEFQLTREASALVVENVPSPHSAADTGRTAAPISRMEDTPIFAATLEA